MLLQVGSLAAPGHVHFLEIGDVNHRPRTYVILHQRDIDRELVVPLYELHGAVQRIYQQEQLPVAPLVEAHFAPLFAQDRNTGLPQVVLDGLVRETVGHGDGGAVAFEADVVVVAVLIDLHDRGPRPDGRIE
jgi:hypothetical protein